MRPPRKSRWLSPATTKKSRCLISQEIDEGIDAAGLDAEVILVDDGSRTAPLR